MHNAYLPYFLMCFLKEFVDRLSGSLYVDQERQDELKQKFGVLPDIITWGD